MPETAQPDGRRRLLFSAATNWLAFLAQAAVVFFLTPYLIRTLGADRYGVWSVIEAVLAYFTLFDLGVAVCLVRYVAKFHATGRHDELNKFCSTSLAVFLVAGGLVLLLGLPLIPLLGPTFPKVAAEEPLLWAAAVLLLANLALTLPLNLFPATLDGLERFGAKSAVRVFWLAVRTILAVAVLEWRPGLFWLAVVVAACNVAELLTMAVLVYRFLPGLRLSLRLVDRPTVREVRGYSLNAFLAMVAGRVSYQTSTIVVGLALGAAQVTNFAAALRLVEYAKNFLRSATLTLTPAISSLEAKGDLAGVRGVMLAGTRAVLYLALPVQAGLMIFGQPFLALWLRGAEGVDTAAAGAAMLILSAGLGLALAHAVVARLLYGVGRVGFLAKLASAEAAVNLGLSLVLVGTWGIEGVAVAMAVPNAVLCVVAIGYACRMLGIDARTYLRRTALLPVAASAALALGWGLAAAAWPPMNWGELVALGAGGLAGYAALVGMLEPTVRRRVGRVMKRVARRVTPAAHPSTSSGP